MTNDPSILDPREAVSALMDGELGRAEARVATVRTARHPELRAAWARYHLARAVLRRDLVGPPIVDLDLRLRARIDGEPPLVVPAADPPARATRPLVGLAVAASVAALALVGVLEMVAPARPGSATPGPAAVALAGPGTVVVQLTGRPAAAIEGPTGVTETGTVVGSASPGWSAAGHLADTRLSTYLLNHYESVGYRTRAIHPYARLVAHERAR